MTDSELLSSLQKTLSPLVEADGGHLYLVSAQSGSIRLHLTGKFNGCPGNSLAIEQVLRPMVQKLRPGQQVYFSSGPLIPIGSTKLVPENGPGDAASKS